MKRAGALDDCGWAAVFAVTVAATLAAAACQPVDRGSYRGPTASTVTSDAGEASAAAPTRPVPLQSPPGPSPPEAAPPVAGLEERGSSVSDQDGSATCGSDARACSPSGDAGPPRATCVPSGPRDCTSELDNDCDGQPDNTVDGVCLCVAGAAEPCDEHPGIDGQGPCRAGSRTCLIGEDSLTSAWGVCEGSVGPGVQDSCLVEGDDTDCDGAPNSGCVCVDGATQPCGSSTDVGVCQIGISTCVNGAFGQCIGAVAPAARDTCAVGDDSNCNGIPNEGCSCLNGDTRQCGATNTGPCAFGTQTCVNGGFGQCQGAVNPASSDTCAAGNDANCNGIPNEGCECIPGQGDGTCSSDPNASRCNDQGQCVPCQTDADCTLVSGRRSLCGEGLCVAPTSIAIWGINGNQVRVPVTSTAANVSGTDLTPASALPAPPAISFSFSFTGWPSTDEVDTAKFFQFGVTAAAGANVTYDQLEFALACFNCEDDTPPASWQVRSNVDGFSGVLAAGTVSSVQPPALVTPSIRNLGTRSGSVTFRLYIFNVELNGFFGFRGPNGAGTNLSVLGGLD
jgi:hypothetical protein